MEGKSIKKLVPVRVTESGKAPIALVRTELLCTGNVLLCLSKSIGNDFFFFFKYITATDSVFRVKVLAMKYE